MQALLNKRAQAGLVAIVIASFALAPLAEAAREGRGGGGGGGGGSAAPSQSGGGGTARANAGSTNRRRLRPTTPRPTRAATTSAPPA